MEYAIMIKRFNRYPLVIDPSGQATEFIMNEYRDRKITKTRYVMTATSQDLVLADSERKITTTWYLLTASARSPRPDTDRRTMYMYNTSNLYAFQWNFDAQYMTSSVLVQSCENNVIVYTSSYCH